MADQLARADLRDLMTDADARLAAWLWGRANRDGSFSWRGGEPRPITASYVASLFGWSLTKAKLHLARLCGPCGKERCQHGLHLGWLRKVGTVPVEGGRGNLYRLAGDLLDAATGIRRREGSRRRRVGLARSNNASGARYDGMDDWAARWLAQRRLAGLEDDDDRGRPTDLAEVGFHEPEVGTAT
jgi:hypothetical protein